MVLVMDQSQNLTNLYVHGHRFGEAEGAQALLLVRHDVEWAGYSCYWHLVEDLLMHPGVYIFQKLVLLLLHLFQQTRSLM